MKEIVNSLGLENIKHNNIKKYKDLFQNYIGRTLTEKIYCFYYDIYELPQCPICSENKRQFKNFLEGYRLTCSRECTYKHPDYRSNLSNTLKKSERAKLQRKERSEKGAKALQDKLSKMSDTERKEFYNIQQESREYSFIKKYGVNNPMKIKEVAEINHKNMRQTNIENRRWLNYDEIGDDFQMYRKKVEYITSKQNIDILENVEKRAHISIEGSYHLDHKYSIKQGFIDNIPVWIIGDIINLEMIKGKHNLSKQENCSISKEDLIKEFYKNS